MQKVKAENSTRRSQSNVFRKSLTEEQGLVNFRLELVSKELNHFGVIAGLFRQIGGHSRRFVLFEDFSL